MLSLSRQFRSDRCLPRSAMLRSAFTLIEIVIALAVLGTMAAGVYLGKEIVNVEPFPTVLSTLTLPPCAWTNAFTRLNPRPKPRVVRL